MATKKKKKVIPKSAPVPDVQSATEEMLQRVAVWLVTPAADGLLYRDVSSNAGKAEWAVLEKARALAINYVRLGTRR